MIIFIVLAVIFSIIQNRTSFGFNVYMYGTNPTAARFSGINSDRVLMRTYWLAGVFAAIAGIVFLSRVNSAKPDYGSSFVLLTVLIAIWGGVSYAGVSAPSRAWSLPCSICSSSQPVSTCSCRSCRDRAQPSSSANLPGVRYCCWS